MRLKDEIFVATAEHNPFKLGKLMSWIDYADATNLSAPPGSNIDVDEQVQGCKTQSNSTADSLPRHNPKTNVTFGITKSVTNITIGITPKDNAVG